MQHVILYLSESFLTTLRKKFGDGGMHTVLDIPVEVIEHHARLLGESLAHGGLAGAHIAYQNDASHFFCFSMIAMHSS